MPHLRQSRHTLPAATGPPDEEDPCLRSERTAAQPRPGAQERPPLPGSETSADESPGGRRTSKHVQAAGPGLRKRLQSGAFGSIRISPELVEGAADQAKMN